LIGRADFRRAGRYMGRNKQGVSDE
jgi:hypothetical protein